jgi:hypothetical protein
LKVIVTDTAALHENALRARANGHIFIPSYIIYELKRRASVPVVHRGFAVSARTLSTRYVVTRFPYDWAPRELLPVRAWLETTDELTLTTEFTP